MQYDILEKPDFSLVRVAFHQPGESLLVEAAAMVAKDSALEMRTQMQGGLLGAAKRKLLGGESVFQNTFTATAPGQGHPLPADIGIGQHRHHGVGLRQLRGRRRALVGELQAVGAEHVAPAVGRGRRVARGPRRQARARRNQDGEHGHGSARLACEPLYINTTCMQIKDLGCLPTAYSQQDVAPGLYEPADVDSTL